VTKWTGLRVIIVLAITWMAGAVPASADITHKVSFSVGPHLMVWSEAGQVLRGAEVALDARGSAAARATSPPALTGRLVPVGAAHEGATTLRLKIASNTGFTIRTLAAAGPAWRVSAHIVAEGPKASAAGAMETLPPIVLLGGETAPVLRLPHRTAARRGEAHEQAVEVEILFEPVSPQSVSTPPRVIMKAHGSN